jgi:DegV family protein with EDD domain
MHYNTNVNEKIRMENRMSRVAITTDSNSGITQAEARELGIKVIPMPFIIDEETYYEDINLTQEGFYEKLKNDADISTTQPSPETVMDMWTELLKEYDEVVYLPMSSGLSGSCQTAMMFSREDEFDGKVFVVDNQRISVTLRQSVLDAIELAKQGKTGQEIHDVLMATKMDSNIYIVVDTLKYLKKGGRVTPAAAALGTLLKIKPVLQIQGEKLDAYAKARTTSQARSIMLDAMAEDIKNRYNNDPSSVWLEIAHSDNEEQAMSFKEELMQRFPEYNADDIVINCLSLSVSCHIGPGSLAVACSKKIQ